VTPKTVQRLGKNVVGGDPSSHCESITEEKSQSAGNREGGGGIRYEKEKKGKTRRFLGVCFTEKMGRGGIQVRERI